MDTPSPADWATLRADALLAEHAEEAALVASGGPIPALRDYLYGLLDRADWRALCIKYSEMPLADAARPTP